MGHIELAAPVSHIWYFKGIPSRMGLILDLSPRTLEKVLYFASYIVLDAGSTDLSVKQVLSEQEYQDARENMAALSVLEWVQKPFLSYYRQLTWKRRSRAESRIKRCYRPETCKNHQETGSGRILP